MPVQVKTPEQVQTARDIAELVGPEWSDMAFRGAYDGASRIDKDLARWNPPLVSADSEQLVDKAVIDARARDMHRNNPHAATATEVHKDSIVGAMYMLNSRPDVRVLGWDDARAEEFQTEIEGKFQTWADSEHRWVDAARKLDLTEMCRLAVGVFVFGGEFLATGEWMTNQRRQFRTAVQLIDTDRLLTPPEQMHNPFVRGGIKHDKWGGAVSAYIHKHHPFDFFGQIMQPDQLDFSEVGFRKPWGRAQVLHVQDHQRIDQSRAVSKMTAGIREMAIGKKFKDITLQNAVVNATYAAAIESELPTEVVMQQLGAGNTGAGDAVATYAEAYLGAISEYVGSSKHMAIDGVKIPHLSPARSCTSTQRAPPAVSGRTSRRLCFGPLPDFWGSATRN